MSNEPFQAAGRILEITDSNLVLKLTDYKGAEKVVISSPQLVEHLAEAGTNKENFRNAAVRLVVER